MSAYRRITDKPAILELIILEEKSMDLDRLKLFAQAAELGSLSKVASLTGAAQSAISRKITALEQECGGRLFSRTGRGVALTEFGERIFPRVKSLLEDADKLLSEMKTSAGIAMGTVHIGLMPSLAHPATSLLLRQVRERFPGIHLHIVEGSGGQLDEWLMSGRIDIAVLFRYSKAVPQGEQTLAVVDTFLVGHPGDTLTRKPTINFLDLDGIPLVLPSIPNGLRVALARLAIQERVNLSVVMEADSLPIQKNVSATGDAYAVLGSHAVGPEVQAGTLQASCIVNPRIKRTIVLSTTTAHPLTLAGREVATLTRRIFESLVSEKTLKVDAPPQVRNNERKTAGRKRPARPVLPNPGHSDD
jgi:LysR family transcriptional regulator, nitrogen assimilation regulatory protein